MDGICWIMMSFVVGVEQKVQGGAPVIYVHLNVERWILPEFDEFTTVTVTIVM